MDNYDKSEIYKESGLPMAWTTTTAETLELLRASFANKDSHDRDQTLEHLVTVTTIIQKMTCDVNESVLRIPAIFFG
jgi:hypothetical protein